MVEKKINGVPGKAKNCHDKKETTHGEHYLNST